MTEHDVRRVARKWARLTARTAQNVRDEILRLSPGEGAPWLRAARESFASLHLPQAETSTQRLADLLAQQRVFEAVHQQALHQHDATEHGSDSPEVHDASIAAHVFSSAAALAFRNVVEASPLDAWQAYHEQFLAEYSPLLRKQSGAYFTPAAVIGYLVRSVDDVLRRHFSLEKGLGEFFAPPAAASKNGRRIFAADPACGVGGFLLGLMQWARANGYPENAAPGSFCGYELAPQTCLAARMLLQRDHHHAAQQIRRLDPLACPPERLPILGDWLAASDRAARSEPPILILLANPPYSNFGQRAGGTWIARELDDYKQGLDEKKNNLDDDCIRFLRWGQLCVERAGAGILAYVTSNTFLSGITHRRMRESLLASFEELYVFNLHGGAKHKRQANDAPLDENIFPIQQGVALNVFVKKPAADRRKKQPPGRLHLAEMRGERTEKIRMLSENSLATTSWREATVRPKYFFFHVGSHVQDQEYQQGVPLNEVFGEYVSGVQTKNDSVYVGRVREEVEDKVVAFLASQEKTLDFSPVCLRRYFTAPFDQRWIYYEPKLLGRPRVKVMQHMLRDNLGLVFMRQNTNDGEYDHFLVVDALVSDRIFYSAHGAAFLAPLYLWSGEQRSANFNHHWLQEFARRLQLDLLTVGRGDLRANLGPEDVFAYLYALFHATAYRMRYAELLRHDFPRVTPPKSLSQFRQLCKLGQSLATHHLCKQPTPPAGVLQGEGTGCIAQGFPKFVPGKNEQAGKIAINPTQAFRNVAQADWQWRVGGYPVLLHWLKARRRIALRPEEIASFQQLLSICRHSRQLVRQIDNLYAQ